MEKNIFRNMRRLFHFFALLVLANAWTSAAAQDHKSASIYYPEAGNWAFSSPDRMGLDYALLQQAVEFAKTNETTDSKDLREAHYLSAFGREPFGYPIGPMKPRGPATGLIIKNGYIVAAWGDPSRVDLTFSVAKSFLSSVVGLAVEDGLIHDVHDKVAPYMAPIVPYEPARLALNRSDDLDHEDVIDLFSTEHNRKITWDHLLRQTSDWEGTLWGKPDWADRPAGASSTWLKRERNEPGTVWKYNDTRVNVLALAALNVWRRPLPVVLKERIMDPIGASSTWRWTGYDNSWVVVDGQLMQSVSGGSHWGGGLFINAYDMARFGYLTLRNGKWKDKQILPESWLKMAHQPTEAQKTYGFMNFFLNTNKALYPHAPLNAFAHIGAGANIIYVDPDNDLIIVARWINPGAMDGLIDHVLQAVRK